MSDADTAGNSSAMSSLRKLQFAAAVMRPPTVVGRLSAGGPEVKWQLRSLWQRPRGSLPMKVALTSWAVVLMPWPRVLARPLANHVCNRATR